MSRRRGEFEHRTSIFEGAYRAWSYLGSLDPNVVTTVDPVTLESSIAVFCYEPLPRAGLSHPFVTSILTPWLGEGAGAEAINLGLTTLRTWWQHRRKGESATAVQALSTQRMSAIVMSYTKHFFALAHCLVVNDGEEAPRSLRDKLRVVERTRKPVLPLPPFMQSPSQSFGQTSSPQTQSQPQSQPQSQSQHQPQTRPSSTSDADSEPYDQQANQLAQDPPGHDPLSFEGYPARLRENAPQPQIGRESVHQPQIPINNPTGLGYAHPKKIENLSKPRNSILRTGSHPPTGTQSYHYPPADSPKYQRTQQSPAYEREKAPIVIMNSAGSLHIVLSVAGMMDGHCVKIVETVLRGTGVRSPIKGLVDVCASRTVDMGGGAVLVRIEQSADALEVGSECRRNLAMVGYGGEIVQMYLPAGTQQNSASASGLVAASNAVALMANEKSLEDDTKEGLQQPTAAFNAAIQNLDTNIAFDWSLSCTCPSGVPKNDVSGCPKRSQLNDTLFKEFRKREEVAKFIHEENQDTSTDWNDECPPSFTKRTYEIPLDMKNGNEDHGNDEHERRSSWRSLLSLVSGIGGGAGGAAGEKKESSPMPEGGMLKRQRTGSYRMPLESGSVKGGQRYSRTFSDRAFSMLANFQNLDEDDNFDINLDYSAGANDDIIAKQRAEAEEKLRSEKES